MRFYPSSEFPRFAPSRHTFRHPLATQSLDTLDPPARHTLPFAPRNHTFRTAKPYILPCKTIRIAFRPASAPSARPRFPPRKRAKTGFPHIAIHPARQHPQPLKRTAAGERKRRHRAPPFIIMVIGGAPNTLSYISRRRHKSLSTPTLFHQTTYRIITKKVSQTICLSATHCQQHAMRKQLNDKQTDFTATKSQHFPAINIF